MADAEQIDDGLDPNAVRGGGWLAWLAWGWVLLIILAAIAELTGWDDLRLALDFQRHFN